MSSSAYVKINANRKWTGYKNYRDISNMNITDLAPGSQNVMVIDGTKIEVRAGSAYLGAQGTDMTTTDPYWTLAGRIHSKYDTFVNNQGTVVPMRLYYSGTLAQGDVIDVWLPIFDASGNPTNTKQWYQMTPTAPAQALVSAHRYFFGEWYDNLNNQNRVVFTYGSHDVSSWTGGYAPITAFTSSTLTTNTTWAEKGFIDPPEGVLKVVVNGIELPVTGDFSTNTITVSSTAGIALGDVAFQGLNFDAMPGTFVADVCSFVETQVYYLSFTDRHCYISWAVNEASSFALPVYAGSSGLNDAVFTGTYTGTTDSRILVTIDSVSTTTQSFFGTGSPSSNFVTSGYTGTTKNTYKLVIIADSVITFAGGVVPAYDPGETIVGNTSGSRFKVVDLTGAGAIYTEFISGDPVTGETYTGLSSGVTSPNAVAYRTQNEAFVYKNNILVTGVDGSQLPSGGLQFSTIGNQFSIPTAIDGLNFNITQIGGNNVGDYYTLVIGPYDTFTWSLDGASQGSLIPLSTSPITLGSTGLSVHFSQITGHAIGDSWTVLMYPLITHGWVNFYFDINGRLPTQGFLLTLDSNGFTMKPQENTMYIVDQAGHISTITFTLASNLQTETVTVTRLKSEQQNSPLFPYLLGYTENQLVSVSQQKTWDLLGRQKLLELPQFKTLSDDVKYDFQTANWTNGDMLYFNRAQYFAVPEEGKIFMWDAFRKYWNPPQIFGKRIGLLSIIDGMLCGHSYEKNETYQLFVGNQDLDEFPIDTAMIFPYDGSPYRMGNKATAAIGMEGYVSGKPDIKWLINCGVGGCQGQPQGSVTPFVCIPKDTASLGKSGLGYHGLGNDPVTPMNYFNFISTFNNYQYYLRNMELRCKSDNQNWSIIAIGTDIQTDAINNASIVQNSPIIQYMV